MELQEQNIKTTFFILVIVTASLFWVGCSSSNETMDDEYLSDTVTIDSVTAETPALQQTGEEPDTKPVQLNQQFSVQSDTLDVQSKRKQKNTVHTSISVKSSAPKKFYTVEVGAFRLQSNVKRHQGQLAKRFKLPVIVFLDTTIHLTRVCVGNFSSNKSASDFLKKMKETYPKDYPDPWVSRLTK